MFGSWDLMGLIVAVAVLAVLVLCYYLVQVRRVKSKAADPTTRFTACQGDLSSRRDLLSRGVIGLFVAALAGVVAAVGDYLARATAAASGGRVEAGSAAQIRALFREGKPPRYDAEAGFYIVPYPAGDLPEAKRVYGAKELAGMEKGFVALSQVCPHLGCKVPWCPTSRFFECPCHGSRFNSAGEVRRGPSPRGLDRYEISVVDGRVIVDTGVKIPGPPPGTDTTGQRPAGRHCY